MEKVYILFGDEPKINGENIHGIYPTREDAEFAMEVLSKHYRHMKIEEHEIIEYKHDVK